MDVFSEQLSHGGREGERILIWRLSYERRKSKEYVASFWFEERAKM